MAEFAYRVLDPNGKSLRGSIEATSEAEAVIKLQVSGYSPVSLREKADSGTARWTRLVKRRRPSRQALEFFSRQLGTLLQAGIPAVEAFETLSRDSELKCLSKALRQVMKDIQGGCSITEAMKKHKAVFPHLYVQMVRAGEVGGVVPETLEQLAQMLEEQRETAQALKSLTRYPMVVLGTLVVAFSVLVGFVLPKLSTLFERFGSSLPLPTKLMLQLHEFLKGNWHFILMGFVGIGVCIYWALRTPAVRYRWDFHRMRLPIFGPLITKICMERFCHTMKVLLQAGVPILTALENVGSTIRNSFVRREISRLRSSVHIGDPMSGFMRRSPAFPHLVAQMIGLGEKSGRMPELLDLCAKHYRREVRYGVKSLLTAIEPLLTLLIGAIVFFFMLSVFLPIWDTVRFFR